MSRRIGRWTYDPTVGWRLDNSSLVLDFDPTCSSASRRGCWLLYRPPNTIGEPVDHYLDAAMRWVEENEKDAA